MVSVGYLILIWVKTFLGALILFSLIMWFLLLILLAPFIMLIMGVIHGHSIKFTSNLVLGSPPPVCPVTNIIFRGIFNAPMLNIFKTHNIKFLGVTSSNIRITVGRYMSLVWRYNWLLWRTLGLIFLRQMCHQSKYFIIFWARLGPLFFHDHIMVLLTCIFNYILCFNFYANIPFIFGEFYDAVENGSWTW